MWFFRIPSAVSLNATRCAVMIFFLRTLYTKSFPRLRAIGTYCCKVISYLIRMPQLTTLVAYGCIVCTVILAIVAIFLWLLHCRPTKYNWAVPWENPRYCFKLKPHAVTIATIALLLDALIWTLPHCVIWRISLCIAHKPAIIAIFALALLYTVFARHHVQLTNNVPATSLLVLSGSSR
jgi:hypothetical protein